MAASMNTTLSLEENILRDITTQFFEMVPIRRMKWKTTPSIDDKDISPDMQRAVLKATVQHATCKQYPPSLSYQRAFVKSILHKLEDIDADICDEIYETYSDLLQQKEEEDDTLCYKTYTLVCIELRVMESVPWHVLFRQDEKWVAEIDWETSEMDVWDIAPTFILLQAALHLAEWCSENSKFLENKRVMELGSGLGLTGITVCRKCQMKSYTFSDCHHQVLYLLMKNIETNFAKHTYLSQPTFTPSDIFPSTSKECTDKKDGRMMKSIRRQLSVNAEPSNPCNVSMCSDIMEISYTSTASSSYDDENSEDIFADQNDFHIESQNWVMDECLPGMYFFSQDERIRLLKYDWETSDDRMLWDIAPDIILAADVVYDKSIMPALVSVLRKLLSLEIENGQRATAFVASTIRNEDTRDHFLIVLANEGLTYEILDSPKKRMFHYEDTIPIEILKIQCPAGS
ncbi:protein-lysine N-methyltransferase EEF2KMT-like [Pecten maximus]|uniref:protein-lysine N-methyltransferase EEF2KMT-like n=1 Tax=Pecten maximus TaxID=6579 RepID=UPI0014581B10|nr:protein-lysine N-methyltransferase EEF2KMT-like [Pecten maximus]